MACFRFRQRTEVAWTLICNFGKRPKSVFESYTIGIKRANVHHFSLLITRIIKPTNSDSLRLRFPNLVNKYV